MEKESSLLEACKEVYERSFDEYQNKLDAATFIRHLLKEAIDREVERQKEFTRNDNWDASGKYVSPNKESTISDLLAEQKETNQLLGVLIENTKSWNWEPPKYKHPASDCCKAPVRTMGEQGGTRYNACNTCGKPCDAITL